MPSHFTVRWWGLTKEEFPVAHHVACVAVVLVVVAATVGIIFTLAKAANAAYVAVGGNSKSQLATPSRLDHCRRFDPTEWQTGQGVLLRDGDAWVLASSSASGLLRYHDWIPLNDVVKVVFVPHSEREVNVVLTMHDLYEIVVGDGGYQGITVKAAKGDGQPLKLIADSKGDRRTIFPDGPMERGADVVVAIEQGVSQLGDGSYVLHLSFKRTSYNGLTPQNVYATYNFELPPSFSYIGDSGRFSIGLKRATDASRVAAEFICVEFESKR